MDTIEMTLPPDITTTGLQTWPLKNRVISTDTVKKTTGEVRENHHYVPPVAKTSTVTIDQVLLLFEMFGWLSNHLK